MGRVKEMLLREQEAEAERQRQEEDDWYAEENFAIEHANISDEELAISAENLDKDISQENKIL